MPCGEHSTDGNLRVVLQGRSVYGSVKPDAGFQSLFSRFFFNVRGSGRVLNGCDDRHGLRWQNDGNI